MRGRALLGCWQSSFRGSGTRGLFPFGSCTCGWCGCRHLLLLDLRKLDPEVSLTELGIFPLKSLGQRGQLQILLLDALHLSGLLLEQLLVLVVLKVNLLFEQTEIPDNALDLDDFVF